MKPTGKSIAAMKLGQYMARLEYCADEEDYLRFRDELSSSATDLGIDIAFPMTFKDYNSQTDEIYTAVQSALDDERSRLGGDAYAKPLFYLTATAIGLILNSLWKTDDYEKGLTNWVGILREFGIEDELEDLRRAIGVEVQWLAEQSDDPEDRVSIRLATLAANRIVRRVLLLWKVAEKHDIAVPFKAPFHSVFISHSTKDREFCDQLYQALRERGVRTWYAAADMEPGKKILQQVRRAIQDQDKLLMVLSDASMSSDWVLTELLMARDRENKEKVRILFPISLVEFDKIKSWEAFDADTGQDLAREVRSYFIPDFSEWRNQDLFSKTVDELAEALTGAEED